MESNNLTLTNKMRGMARVGFLAKSVRGGFVYAATGDTPVGVIKTPSTRGKMSDIQTTGEVKVFVDETVAAGVELRMAVAGEGGRIGSVRAIKNETNYVSVGTSLEGGKGLIRVALNIKSSGGGGGGDVEEAPIDGTPYARQDAGWVASAAGILDAPSDNLGYARRNAAWVNSGLILDYSGGTGTMLDTINWGETLTFNAAGDLSVTYDPVNNIIQYNHTPAAVYTDWNLYTDGVKRADIASGDYANWAAGTGIDIAFTSPGSPVMNTVTINIDQPWLSSNYYTQSAVDTLITNFINDAPADNIGYARRNNSWVNSGLIIDYSGGSGTMLDTINYGEHLVFLAAGSGLGTSYNPTTNTVTYTFTPAGSYYDGWFIDADSGGGGTDNVVSTALVTFTGGTNISTVLAYATPGGTPPVTAEVTVNLDSNISITTATASSYLRVDNGSYHINVGAETISFTRNSSNYFRASTVGGNFSFVTNGRTGAYAEAMLFVGTTYVDLKYGTGTTTALKLRTSSTGVDVSGTVKATHIPSEVGLIASASSSTSNGGRLRLENTAASQATGTKAGRIEFYKADGSTQGAGVVGEIYTIAIDAGGTYNMYFTTGQDVETPLGSNGTMYLDYLGTLHVSTLQSSGHVRASTYFRSDNTAAVLGTASAGTVYLRPNGYSSATYEVNANSSRLYSSTAIQSASEITAYSSDRRLKNNVRRIPNALDIVCSVDGVLYNWNDDVDKYGFTPTRKSDVGFIAQNFGQHIIGGSAFAPFDRDVDGNSISGQDFLTVKPEKVIPYLVEAIKELREILEENGIRIK